MAIIFGATYTLQYVDPFLFLAYEFRKWTLESKLILCIGYSFGDEHVNGILGQALRNDTERKLLSVTPLVSESTPQERREALVSSEAERIEDVLQVSGRQQVECWSYTGKEFLTDQLDLEKLSDLFPKETELFAEAPKT